jgi:hypothetical protein
MQGFRSAVAATSPTTDIYVRGPVDAPTIAYVQTVVACAASTGPPAQRLKTKIAEYGEDGNPPLCVAQVNVEVQGRLVRRQVAAPSAAQAIDQVTASLPPALHRLHTHLTRPAGPPEFSADEWQQRRLPRTIPTYARPRRQPRRLVRHKAFPLATQDPASAALTMDLRDYDFYLFANDHDGRDSVVYRAAMPGYRMSTVNGTTEIDRPTGSPVEFDSDPLPLLSLPEAIRRLDAGGRAFFVFAGAVHRRAEILYRRYDGHLGLVTPV